MSERRIEDERQMTAFDHLLFRAEERPEARSTLLSAFVLDSVPDFARVQRAMERASRVFLRLRQHVVVPAIPIAGPEWVVDPDFDLHYHLRRAVLPAPGDMATMLRTLEPFLMAPLDRARPLWEAILYEGFEGGRAVFALKVNHALTDGLGGVELMLEILDLERDPPEKPMPPVPVPEDLTSLELTRSAFNRLPGRLLSLVERRAPNVARFASQVVADPAAAVAAASDLTESVRRLVGGPSAEPSPVLRRRSLSRRLAAFELPLDDLRAAARAVGGSVNDAYLAAIGGALRRYHDHLGVPVDAVPAAVPVSLRHDEHASGGNHWAGVQLPLPVGEVGVRERVALIRQHMAGARDEPAMRVMDLMAPLMSRAPSVVLDVLSSAAAANDVQASNIPGPSFPLYTAGAKIEQFFGFGPLPGPAMMIVLFSYDGRCFVGVNYDAVAVTDHSRFEECLREGFDEVIAAGRPEEPARTTARPRRAPAKKRAVRQATAARATSRTSGRTTSERGGTGAGR
jgi:diacylglycerol O-acyltransferase